MAADEAQVVQSQQFTDVSQYCFSGNSVTVENKQRFITLYREHGTVYHAAYYTPVARKTVYAWINTDDQFAEAFHDSRDDSLDDLETSVYKRAFKSDLLAMFYLKAHRPKFRDKVSIDIEGVKDEINQRIQELGLHLGPAMITTTTLDGDGSNGNSNYTPDFPHLPDSEQKE